MYDSDSDKRLQLSNLGQIGEHRSRPTWLVHLQSQNNRFAENGLWENRAVTISSRPCLDRQNVVSHKTSRFQATTISQLHLCSIPYTHVYLLHDISFLALNVRCVKEGLLSSESFVLVSTSAAWSGAVKSSQQIKAELGILIVHHSDSSTVAFSE